MSEAWSARGYPWARAVLVVLVGMALYAAIPVLSPLTFSNETTVPSLGFGLGLAVGVAAKLQPRLLPALALGAALMVAIGAVAGDLRPSLAIGLGIGVAGEVLLVAYLFRRYRASDLRVPVDVLSLVTIAFAVAIPVAVLAALVVKAYGAETDYIWHEVRAWSTDDIFGLVVIAPALMLAVRPSRWAWNRAPEFVVAAALSLGAAALIFFTVDPANPGLLGWPYLAVLGPAWVAVRLGVAAVAPVAALVFWMAAIATAQNYGPFSRASTVAIDRVVAAELFGIVLMSCLLALGILRDDRRRQLARAAETSRLLREVIDGSDAVVYAKDYSADAAEGRYVLVNRAWETRIGISQADTLGRTDRELFGSDAAGGHVQHDHLVLAYDEPIAVEDRQMRRRGNSLIITDNAKFPLRGADGRAWGIGGIATDITESVQIRERVERQSQMLRAVFELSPTPAMRMKVVADRSLDVLDANAAMLNLLGLPAGAVDQCDLLSSVHPDDVGTVWDIIGFAITSSGTHGVPSDRQRELRISARDDRTVWVLMSAAAVQGDGSDTEIVAQFEDFTARREAEAALTDQALRDSVTGLPNRRALNDRLASALLRLGRTPGTVTVLFCDLDRFKDVNDTYGHHVGDELLVEVAGRLRSALRPDDTVARLGGDEFVVLTESAPDTAAAVLTGVRLQDRLAAPWEHGGQTFRPEMSIGIARTDDATLTVDELLRRADLAMYEAKDAGRNRIEVYQRSVDDQIQRAVAIQHDLRRAIDDSLLLLHYQPIVRLVDGGVVGAEALVRMEAEGGRTLLPADFVPQAESSGLVVPMGAWVMRRAMADLKAWRERGHDYVVSVNVSQWQHREDGFAGFVLDAAASAGVDPSWLIVEVTETALIHDPERSGRELAILSESGVGVALDDFGTGFSSLSWLTQLPVTTVKIDQLFTAALGSDARKGAIVRALIDVSHDLGLTVVAEGIETPEQHARLLDLGCDRGQGYLFGVPTTIDEASWL